MVIAFLAVGLLRLVLSASGAANTLEEVVAVKERLSPGRPITVIFPLARLLSAEHVKLESLPIRLVIDGVKIISGQSAGFRIFVNRPDADADTPTTDLHYAASVAFYPSGPTEQASTYVVDLIETLKSLAATGQLANSDRLAVTLVAIPAEGAPKEFPVRIDIQSLIIKIDWPK